MRILVTGGAGFIGSAVARRLLASGHERVVVLDALTYSGCLASLEPLSQESNFRFAKGDILNSELVRRLLDEERINGIMHLAAESHVDRSLDGPVAFLDTNVVGTFRMLQAALEYWRSLEGQVRKAFRFHHVSTDEVFGDLPFDKSLFDEQSPYRPSSPYSASKAASDHFVRAWHHSFGLPVVMSNCSNNYGPRQFPEKLIPLTILQALEEKELPVYGRGENVRDWLHVADHAEALELVLTRGRIGESYNVGGSAERRNIDVVEAICALVDERRPAATPRRDRIRFVGDRPGHDRRYAVDAHRLRTELGWRPRYTELQDGLRQTVAWYRRHRPWWERQLSKQDRSDGALR